MRILHASHIGLPYPRIEKSAQSMKKEGHELLFLGGHKSKYQNLDAFDKTFHVQIPNSLMLVLSSSFKKAWIRKVDEIQPDIVHAHNIIAAAMMLGSEYPVIYDDHEYWSKEIFKFSRRPLIRRVASIPLARKIPKWEKDVLKEFPVITVSEPIAREHGEIADCVEVIRNFPARNEISHIDLDRNRSGIVYVGNDFSLSRFLPHRDMSGLADVIEFDCIQGLPHKEMMQTLATYEVGLTPWRKHPFHQYCDPNKTYEYLHAGLQVVITSSLTHSIEDSEYIHEFREYSEIVEIIQNLPSHDPHRIAELAKRCYLWENQEPDLKRVYRKAMEQ